MLLHNDKTRVWFGMLSELNHIGIEKAERFYDHMGNPDSNWLVTLVAHKAKDIKHLLELESLDYIEVGFVNRDQADKFENGVIFLVLKNCVPRTGWFENLVIRVTDGNVKTLVAYRLMVMCQVEHDMDSLINL